MTRIADHCPLRAYLVCRALQSEPSASWLLLSTWCFWGGPTRRNHCSNPKSLSFFHHIQRCQLRHTAMVALAYLMTHERVSRDSWCPRSFLANRDTRGLCWGSHWHPDNNLNNKGNYFLMLKIAKMINQINWINKILFFKIKTWTKIKIKVYLKRMINNRTK